MTSTLGHTLLGLLAARPSTGYDLARRLRRPVGYFWSAGHSQIYPELARLEGDGLLRHTVVAGAGPRDTKRYRVTAAGRRALRAWLLATTPDVDEREILLRVYLLFALSPAEAVAVVEAVREHHRRTLAEFLTHRTDDDAATQEWGPDVTSRTTLEWGITFEEGRIRWCEGILVDLRRRLAEPLVSPPSPPR
ncbi:MAG: PadR family transcriptional regulator [Lapillicoccus sp.]